MTLYALALIRLLSHGNICLLGIVRLVVKFALCFSVFVLSMPPHGTFFPLADSTGNGPKVDCIVRDVSKRGRAHIFQQPMAWSYMRILYGMVTIYGRLPINITCKCQKISKMKKRRKGTFRENIIGILWAVRTTSNTCTQFSALIRDVLLYGRWVVQQIPSNVFLYILFYLFIGPDQFTDKSTDVNTRTNHRNICTLTIRAGRIVHLPPSRPLNTHSKGQIFQEFI